MGKARLKLGAFTHLLVAKKSRFVSHAMRTQGDVVLVYYKNKPALYARIEAIEPDTKKGWYQVTLLLLTIPAQTVTWLLREEYIDGTSFTMGGQAMRLEHVRLEKPKEGSDARNQSLARKRKRKGAKVVSFARKDPDHLR